jgi:hypothetical protein
MPFFFVGGFDKSAAATSLSLPLLFFFRFTFFFFLFLFFRDGLSSASSSRPLCRRNGTRRPRPCLPARAAEPLPLVVEAGDEARVGGVESRCRRAAAS